MKKGFFKASLPIVTSVLVVLGTILVVPAFADISSYSASTFAQFCASNPTTCKKVDFQNVRSGNASCPATNQTVQEVYVHAGGGQTVYKLPHTGFDFTINGNNVDVSLTTHQNDISWIGVVCAQNSPTPSPSASPSPSVSPSPSPSPSVSPSPSPSPSQSPSPSPSLSPSPSPSPSPRVGSITVCKVIIDENGIIVDGSAVSGSTFNVPGLNPAQTSEVPPTGVIPDTNFTAPLTFNADLFNELNGDDSECVTYNVALGSYYYDQEQINDSDDFEDPLYNDEFLNGNTLSDLYEYNDTLFDGDNSNNQRNTKADGHIIISDNNPNRTLIVLNQIDDGGGNTGGGSPTPTPSPSPSVSPSPSPTSGGGGSSSSSDNNSSNSSNGGGQVAGASTAGPNSLAYTGIGNLSALIAGFGMILLGLWQVNVRTLKNSAK